jgi:hypothetical protein
MTADTEPKDALHLMAIERLAWVVGLVRAEELLETTLRMVGLRCIESPQHVRDVGTALLASDEASWIGALLALHGERLLRARH